ncbi:MAG: fused MFS/spermidine synthase [Bryobacteraceae bacterium]|nr:fused MFS/spermidine synthase [Bryobacteraceae bacterium]
MTAAGKGGSARPSPLWVIGPAVVLGAFLLFLVQPMAGKRLLPLFGGSAAVWSSCLLFFQSVLLAGYVYAHLLARRLEPRRQAVLHALVALACLLAPRVPPRAGGDPLHVLLALAGTVGLPYFLLSTTSPLLQHWLALADSRSRPYRLSAWSNAACALALVAFPFLLEPRFPLSRLERLWHALFAAEAFLLAAVAFLLWRLRPAAPPRPLVDGARWRERLRWLAWSALGSAFLVATTAHLTQVVAPAPLLWVAPMLVYLLTYVAAFAREEMPGRRLARHALLGLLGMALALLFLDLQAVLAAKLGLYCLGLFLVCLFAHGTLAASKPEPARLTSFWTHAAAGGALGSLLAGVALPSLLKGYFELPLLMALTAPLCLWKLRGGSRWATQAAWMAAIFAATPSLALVENHYSGLVDAGRNFYGSLRIVDEPATDGRPKLRKMLHGLVVHGSQFLAPELEDTPTAYYGRASAAGLLLSRPGAPRRAGIIGLGAGALAAYGRPGDVFRFYEINPMVVGFSRRYFTYLARSAARIEIAEGDARLTLAAEPPQRFDVLAVDAFSGDAIPAHLLTREAFALYLRHLAPGGALAFHISNQYADLAPVVRALAADAGVSCTRMSSPPDARAAALASVWMVVDTARPASAPADRRYLWTDDENSILRVLR